MRRLSLTCACLLLALPASAFTESEIQQMNDAVESLCPLIEQQSALQLEIKLEKQNPAQVINLRRLYELGRLVQITRVQIRDESRENRAGLKLFRQFAKKPLDVGFCVAHREAREREEAGAEK